MTEAKANIPEPAAQPTGVKKAAKAPRRIPLFWRVCGFIWGLLFVSILVQTCLTMSASNRLLRQKLVDHAATLAATVTSSTSNLVASEDVHSLQAVLFSVVQGDSLIAGARICDKLGAVICYSRDEERGTSVPGLVSPPAQTEARELARPDGSNVLQVTAPLFRFGDPWGTFQLELSMAHLGGEIDATIERSLWTALVVLLLGTAAAALLARSFMLPLRKLSRAAVEVAKGNFLVKTGVESQDELGDLGRAFDQMTAELSRSTVGLRAHSTSLARQVTLRTQAFEAKSAELEAMKKQVASTGQSKRDLISSFTQEMRSPVDQIIAMADIALDTHLSPEQRQYVTFAKEAALGLHVMLRSSAEYLSKLERGVADAVLIGFQLRAVVEDVLRLYANKASARELELICQVQPDVPDSVVGNPDRVRQVLLNLIGNAIKFTREGEVVLRVERESLTDSEAAIHFLVRDTGTGIPPDMEAQVREALSVGKEGASRAPDGAILGLAISAQLAESLGGRIWFESDPGKGCTFHFQARFAIQRDTLGSAHGSEAAPLQDRSALVVASNATLGTSLEETLRAWGIRTELTDGAFAVEALANALEGGSPPDFLVLDAAVTAPQHHALWKAVEANRGVFGALVLIGANEASGSETEWWSSVTRFYSLEKPVKESDLLQALLAGTRPLEEAATR